MATRTFWLTVSIDYQTTDNLECRTRLTYLVMELVSIVLVGIESKMILILVASKIKDVNSLDEAA
ncbi:MAG TPA: hypothetical protein VJS37_05450 [Terriglobales bacterium]|nr:hypothetical protein [Terriglobales bacterium]